MVKYSKKITHLILSDGGFKGFVYLGILRFFYIHNLIDSIKNISGTSIGALFAVIFALKIPIEYIEKEFYEVLEEVRDNKTCFIDYNCFHNLFIENGILSLDFLINPIKKYLKSKYEIDDITFIDFIKKTGVNIYINCTNINTNTNKVFSADDTPNISVIEVLRATMCIPIIFKPIKIDDEYYIDGCINQSLTYYHDTFGEVPEHNKLFIYINPNISNITDCSSSIEYIKQTLNIMFNYKFKKTENTKKDFILTLNDIPYEEAMKFHITKKNIKINVSQEDLNKLILKGFIDISEYMSKFLINEKSSQ